VGSGENQRVPAESAPADARSRRPAMTAARRKIAGFLPSPRSIAVGAGIAAIAAGGYTIARETSLFAIRHVEVTGGSRALDAQVARALVPFVGHSLIGLDGGAVVRRTDAMSTVISASYDRAFPSALHVRIVPERPAAVLRDGRAAWIVSERDRVMRQVAPHSERRLPRIWAAVKSVRSGEILPLHQGGALTRALVAAGSFRSRIANGALANGRLVFHLKSGLELVLGSPSGIPLKVAVAAEVLRQVPAGTVSIDVSVPSRPVTSTSTLS
jgi:hypothetical protein